MAILEGIKGGEIIMYELEQGSKRLATALKAIESDETALQRIADYLNYRPRQLAEDIAALYDKVYQKQSE